MWGGATPHDESPDGTLVKSLITNPATMRYVAFMGMMFPVTAALLVVASPAVGRAVTVAASDGGAPASALRFADGASASVTVSARIVRAAAIVGGDGAPPAPGMIARQATVTAADGRAVPALIYDFE